ncbi:ABC transporter substrate-binding protein [Enterococcus timonensis]|uniref:ABC transporter substrate-binding protein n=1 Tax=Enterococcus timonensis TaxID=1852364 RepID=UPI0008DA5FDC|nr:ABC transporter substrate-binding protein [Enterococcus timonensis]
MKLKKLFLLSVFLLLFSGCTAKNTQKAQGNTASGDTIKIGLNLELSGAAAAYGNQEKEGAEFAAAEINRNGGILGKKVELILKDNKSETTEAFTVTANLARSGVVAIIGPATSSGAKAAIPNLKKSGVPMITPSATDDALTFSDGQVQEFVFRSCFQDSLQGTILAKFAAENLQAQKVVILGDNSSDYAVGLSKAFKENFVGEIVAEENFSAGDKDFQALLTKINGQDFDALYVPSYYTEAGLIIKQAREMGITQPILGGDGFSDPEMIAIAGAKNVSNVFYSNHFSTSAPATKKAADFLAEWRQNFGSDPSAFQALSYDALYMIKAAIEEAGVANSLDIKKALANLQNFSGVTGKMSVNDQHNPQKDVVVLGLTEGVETSAEIVSPDEKG